VVIIAAAVVVAPGTKYDVDVVKTRKDPESEGEIKGESTSAIDTGAEHTSRFWIEESESESESECRILYNDVLSRAPWCAICVSVVISLGFVEVRWWW
jgi:hypothetical protein